MNIGLSTGTFRKHNPVCFYFTILLFYSLQANANSAPATALKWIIKPPGSPLSVGLNGRIPVAIVVGGTAATGVKVLQAGLVEQSRKYPISEHGLTLCENLTSNPCNQPIDIPSDTGRTLWLVSAGGLNVGHFAGPVTISSSLKPDGDTINLDIYVTTFWHQVGGAVTIFFSVMLAWIFSSYGRHRFNRGQLLLPAALIREKLARMTTIINHAPPEISPPNISTVSKAIRELDTKLSTLELEKSQYIPGNLPNPFEANTGLKTDEYKQFLQTADESSSLLRAIIEDGMEAAWNSKMINWSSQSHITLVNQATASLDSIASIKPLPLAASVITTIQSELDKLRQNLNPAGMISQSALPLRDYDEIKIEIRNISVAAWIVSMLITTLLGTYVVVFSNLGFGTWPDYFLCAFWGIGLPIAANQILQQTTESVPKALGISLRR